MTPQAPLTGSGCREHSTAGSGEATHTSTRMPLPSVTRGLRGGLAHGRKSSVFVRSFGSASIFAFAAVHRDPVPSDGVAARVAAWLSGCEHQLRRSVCAAGQPACPQVSRYIGLSTTDRKYPALTGRSGTQRARRLRSRMTWLPAAHVTGHRDALVLVTDIGPSTGEGTAPCPDPAVCQPEKRKVGSSTLPLTTSFGLVSSALTSANVHWALWCPQPPSDHDCPCVTMVGRPLTHVDRTSRLHAPPPNPIAAEPGDGRVLSRPSSRVHEPRNSPDAVAQRPQAVLTGSGSHRYSYGGFGGGHPRFHLHTDCRQPDVLLAALWTPGYGAANARVALTTSDGTISYNTWP